MNLYHPVAVTFVTRVKTKLPRRAAAALLVSGRPLRGAPQDSGGMGNGKACLGRGRGAGTASSSEGVAHEPRRARLAVERAPGAVARHANG